MDTLVLPYALNREKHIKRIVNDVSKPNTEIQVNKQGEDIGIQCNPGFWLQVAKPLLCSPTKGYAFSCPNTSVSFLLTEIRYHVDGPGTETGRILTLSFSSLGTESVITVTLHHGTRLVQVQGGLVMPDRKPSALWFLDNILSPKLTSMAEKKKLDITD